MPHINHECHVIDTSQKSMSNEIGIKYFKFTLYTYTHKIQNSYFHSQPPQQQTILRLFDFKCFPK